MLCQLKLLPHIFFTHPIIVFRGLGSLGHTHSGGERSEPRSRVRQGKILMKKFSYYVCSMAESMEPQGRFVGGISCRDGVPACYGLGRCDDRSNFVGKPYFQELSY